MLFKRPGLAAELLQAHPEIQALVRDLDKQLRRWGLGEAVVTDVLRDRSFYPDGRWSWHYCGNALDIRTSTYSDVDLVRVVAWIQGRVFGKDAKWDIIPEPHAPKGAHLHIEVEDWLRRREWEQKQAGKA